MPYARDETISKAPIVGAIEISDEEYRDAKAAKLAGRQALVIAGQMVIRDKAPGENYVWENGQWRKQPPPTAPAVDPLTQPVTKHQICAALIQSGTSLTPDQFVRNAIAAISDPTRQALVLNDWENAPYYMRDHELFSDADLLTEAGLLGDQIDQIWQLAVTLPVYPKAVMT